MTNYAQTLTEYFQSLAPGVEVYGNVDPNREWGGVPMLEITETAQEYAHFISGNARARRKLVAAIRAETATSAEELAASVRDLLRDALDRLQAGGTFESWTFQNYGLAPDSRGNTSGDSFVSFVEFDIIDNPQKLY